ncbi:MAG TPA: DUF2252 domain-containing protein [Chthoniobacteraceae bacterium]|nr:DUF2252 domain-containing protein [Chthoniobacteraceae bacterium]
MKPPAFPTAAERRALGQNLRKKLKRVDQGKWKPAKDRHPLRAILAANAGRLPSLVPLKMARMSVSPFAFFRGSASLMAADLAESPVTGLYTQICGDAHVRNLGAYAAPDGHLVFDINDFDETTQGPWEWDLKRLATSVVLSGREAGDSEKICAQAVATLVASYREAMDVLAEMKVINLVKYEIRRFAEQGIIEEVLNKARRVTPVKTLQKLTQPSKDQLPRFQHQPPVLHHVDEATRKKVIHSLKSYRETVNAGHQIVFDAYKPADVAFKVVGTGSVGTRDYVVLLFGNGPDDPMFLQIKEELPSCYAPHLKNVKQAGNNGRRVAEGQQRMQTVTDPFIGWTCIDGRDYLVRQLADRKAAIDPIELKGRKMFEYVTVCGETLAKAHARTGDPLAIAGYCGDTAKLDGAIAKFATAYADQMTKDFGIFIKAIKAGKIKAA